MLFMSLLGFGAGGKGGANIQSFYDTVVQSQQCLDAVADDVYTCWYDAIFGKKYSGDIDVAIETAISNNSENLNIIETNDEIIKSLYKKVKKSNFATEVKAVMSAYSDYYEFVVNVSGSFRSYSSELETFKKQLASALKDLQLEM